MLHARDADQQIPYEYYQPHRPVNLQQAQDDMLQQYQTQRQLAKDQQQWKPIPNSRFVPHIQVSNHSKNSFMAILEYQ